MILELLWKAISSLINVIINAVNIPKIPDDVDQSINSFIDNIIVNGAKFIDFVLPLDTVTFFLKIVITIVLFIGGYHFVMFILKKIPMINIH